jgi:hypothetical protein
MNITAPMPIHSRQRSPFGSLHNIAAAPPPPVQQQQQNVAAPAPVGQSRDQLAYMQSLIQRQLYEQKVQHQQHHLNDRSGAVNQAEDNMSAVINNTFTPTSVIRKMASMKADEKLAREGDGSGKGIDMAAAVNSPDGCPMSPSSHPDLNRTGGARRLVGQGSSYQPPLQLQSDAMHSFMQAPPPLPIGRPIVKGSLPSNNPAIPSLSNNFSNPVGPHGPYTTGPIGSQIAPCSPHAGPGGVPEQLRLHQMKQIMGQLHAAGVGIPSNAGGHVGMPAGSGHVGMPAGLMQQYSGPPPGIIATQQQAANNALLLQQIHRASQQQQQQQLFAMPPGPIGQQQQRVIRPAVGGATDKQQQMDPEIARFFASSDICRSRHRLPNMPGQKVMTLDEIECPPPTAN